MRDPPDQFALKDSSSSIEGCSLGPNYDLPPKFDHVHAATSRLFALIIGINNYKNWKVKPLKGAVADANGIEEYLEKKLNVPNSHIRKLLDEEASRANIIQAFEDLINNTVGEVQIQKDDAIVIYYAGHGDLVDAPAGWPTGREDQKIQSIVPHDQCTDEGRLVDVIPDITIGALIHRIAEKWGNNITVIFDCCHSGSGTRVDDLDTLCRSAMLENYSIPPDLDQELWPTPGATRGAMPVFSNRCHDSHILLAACGSGEEAKEESCRGRFTTALLNVLNNISPNQVTYEEVLNWLGEIPGQNPQLEGTPSNCKRTLFNSRVAHVAHNCHGVSFNSISGCYELHAGAAQGVCKDDEFKIYPDMVSISKGTLLAVAAVESVGPFHSILAVQTPLQLDRTVIAIESKVGGEEGLKLYLNQNVPLYDDIQKESIGARGLALVDRSAADLEIVPEGNRLVFKILDKDIINCGLTQLSDLVDPNLEDVKSVLCAAAHYFRFLKRSQTDPKLHCLIQNLVDIEFLRLEYSHELGPYGKRLRKFVGNNLIKGGKIILDIENEGDIYGINIINKSQHHLYANTYYPLSYCGKAYHFKEDASLTPRGKLTLGYGPAGGVAFKYMIPQGQDVDVGFLKFFFSTSPVDLSAVEQISPFDQGKRKTGYAKEKPLAAWGTICIPFTQRRPKPF